MNAESYTIFHDFEIQVAPTKVIEAVSKPEHLNNWWTLKCTGEPKIGSEYNLYFATEYDWLAQVIEYHPEACFHLKMTDANLGWETTSFGFDVETTEKGALVHFWHMGWQEANSHFKISSFCWAMLLNGLKNYLEKGVVVPFEERS